MISNDKKQSLLNRTKEMLAASNDVESILKFLRHNDCTIIDCISIIEELQGLTFGEAKRLVHYSKTWEDMRKRTEIGHESIFQALENSDENWPPDHEP